MRTLLQLLLLAILAVACNMKPSKGSYAYDYNFLKKHKNLVVLKAENEKC